VLRDDERNFIAESPKTSKVEENDHEKKNRAQKPETTNHSAVICETSDSEKSRNERSHNHGKTTTTTRSTKAPNPQESFTHPASSKSRFSAISECVRGVEF
jgi:hypothetical protein